MRCEKARRMMSARIDGHLGESEIARVEEHLMTCSACQVEWHRMQMLDHLFASAPMVRAPSGLRARVEARIRRREEARRAIIGSMTLVLGTITLVLLMLVPFLAGLLEKLGLAPVLVSGGPETVAKLLAFFSTMGRALLVVLEQFAGPFAILAMCSLIVALMLNGLLLGTMYRLRVTS